MNWMMRLVTCLGLTGVWAGVALSQTPANTAAPPPSAPAKRSAADLEKLAAPVALYPDPLLAVVLPASVYPVEIVQAARLATNANNMSQIEARAWDSNVKSLAKFPDVIKKMSDDLDWTVQLGQAFLEQPMDLMNAIQSLRAKATANGVLKNTPQQTVISTNAVVERTYEGQVVYVTNTVIQVQPASTNVVYVPSYNPQVIYVHDDDDDIEGLVSFGVGMAFGAAIWGNCDWYYGGCYWGHYPPPPPPYPPPYHPPPGSPRPPSAGRPPGGERPERPGDGTRPGGQRPTQQPSQRWQPDQSRLRSSGAATAAPSTRLPESRGWSSGGPSASTRPSTGTVGTRPTTTTRPEVVRPSTTPSPAPSTRPSAQPSRSSSSAFNGVSNTSAARDYSSRGSSSRGSTSFGGGGVSRGGGFSGGGSRGGGRGGGRR
jgi:uncharacterized membrane protein YgcG